MGMNFAFDKTWHISSGGNQDFFPIHLVFVSVCFHQSGRADGTTRPDTFLSQLVDAATS
jgi:hypothetical protein